MTRKTAVLRRILTVLLCACMLLTGLSTACAADYGYAGAKGTIVISEDSSAGLARGDSLQLTTSGSPIVSCSSSKSKIATADNNGLITAKKAGKAKITVQTAAGETFTLSLTVVDRKKPSSISFTKKKETIYPSYKSDVSGYLKAKPYAEAFDLKSVKWSSSDESVAKVNKNGVVTAKRAGSATITAKTKNDKTAKFTIKVKANKLNNIEKKPKLSAIGQNKFYLYLKSVEIVSSKKVVLEYYLLFNYPSSYETTHFTYLDSYITYRDSNGERKVLVDGEATNVKVSVDGQSVGTFKVTYSGDSVSNTDVLLPEHKNDIECYWNAYLNWEYPIWTFSGNETETGSMEEKGGNK